VDSTVDDTGRWIRVPGGQLMWRHAPGNTVEIVDIEVTDNRRTGIGRNMVARLCASLPRDTTVYAITRPGNAIAVEFYEGLGFHVLGVLRSFYTESSGVDAVMFGRKAGGPV
jgi:ribosomal protein S18 acetylase RimI-like enzyme